VNKLISIYDNERVMRNTATGYSWEIENCDDEILEIEENLTNDNSSNNNDDNND
jgi:hypothetical protein